MTQNHDTRKNARRHPLGRGLLPLLAAGLLLLGPAAQARETLVFAHLFQRISLQQEALIEAKQELLDRSGGEIDMDIKPDAKLGNQDSRILDAVNFGQADMTFAGGPFAARDYAPMGIIGAPYGFRDYTHWQHFKVSSLARELTAQYEKASAQIVLGYYYNGERHLISRTPVRTLEDMAELRIRVPNAPIYLQLFRTLGAKPVPLPLWQTYDALKQGNVDAAEKTLSMLEDGEFYEVAPYVSLTGHISDIALIVISSRRWSRLDAGQQQLVRDVFSKMADRLSERIHAKELANLEKLKRRGVTFIPVDRRAFIAKLAPLLNGNDFPWSGALYERLQKIP
ncbi:TRAP transporter substrate-binding protein DctP [Telmatospirillum siberiense]|uniref:ABC transporter substrate-binding protein n=1 Tax=Telmatospirillum siberiense TaxID=382514 RepID=A0A2N3PWT9_9PROT|nr:TRAP transporter substrate-binding protein DctP [Telmatospirillum siberiense]PKU24851.1 hypothetical protein CWS72_09735 [Telmatospirillum siberiense]